MRKIAAALAIAGLSALLPMGAASAREYGSQQIDSTRFFTWVFLDPAAEPYQGAVLGYACDVKDSLLGMTGVATADRYAIRWFDGGTTIHPLNGIVLTNDNGSIRARASNPDREAAQFLELSLTSDPIQGWFLANSEVDALGRSCVDGGVAAVLEELERDHGIQIRQ